MTVDNSVLIFGCSGLVGKTLLHILEKRLYPIGSLTLVASKKSVGKHMFFRNKKHTIISATQSLALPNLDLVFFCSSATLSEEYTPKYIEYYPKVYVIDNSSCWRMNPLVPIIIPPINKNLLIVSPQSQQDRYETRIFANSNCTTSGLVLFLNTITEYVSEVHIVSIQSCSGSGYKGNNQLEDERSGIQEVRKYYECDIDQNLIPKIGDYAHNPVQKRKTLCDTGEELKLVLETNKILETDYFITATCIRCPIYRGHSLAITVKTNTELDKKWVEERLRAQKGLVYSNEEFFTPKYAFEKYDVYVSRLRCSGNTISAFITFDNLYRGASWNSVDIAEHLWNLGL